MSRAIGGKWPGRFTVEIHFEQKRAGLTEELDGAAAVRQVIGVGAENVGQAVSSLEIRRRTGNDQKAPAG